MLEHENSSWMALPNRVRQTWLNAKWPLYSMYVLSQEGNNQSDKGNAGRAEMLH